LEYLFATWKREAIKSVFIFHIYTKKPVSFCGRVIDSVREIGDWKGGRNRKMFAIFGGSECWKIATRGPVGRIL
jgi:hypothetical protein